MESLSFIFPLIMLAGVGALALVVVAIAQDLRQERKYGYRQAFFTIVTLAMIVLTVGSGISLLIVGLKESVFKSAISYTQRFNSPPPPYFGSSKDGVSAPTTTAYTCQDSCQFTVEDKQAFSDWKTSYTSWKQAQDRNLQLRRDLAGALAMFLVTLPLYLVFVRLMNRGANEEMKTHQKPSPLRSVYYYGVSFGGLLLAVVGGAMILYSVLRVALKVEDPNTMPAPTTITSEKTAAESVINCASACGFTSDEVELVRDWKSENQKFLERQSSTKGAIPNDLANTIPLLVFGLPLFWYHFARIRKESAAAPSTPASAD